MKIWIDLANSPQVLLFRPLIRELRARGNSVTVTSRQYAQTTELASQYGIEHTPIGSHGGKRISALGARLLERSIELSRFARGQMFDLAVSHGSYAQALASAAMRIPFVTLMDYEYQPANHICFRLARRVIVPACFPRWALRKFGAESKACVYHGLKEHVYLADFQPQAGYLDLIGIPTDRVVVVMRPPASWSLYHHFDNPLFDKTLEHVTSERRAFVVFLPRIASQVREFLGGNHENVWIPEVSLDGPNLLYWADIVISAGGTMNREAAVLGTVARSVFGGRLAAVDRCLIERGRMALIKDEMDIEMIEMEKRPPGSIWFEPQLIQEITQFILSGADGG
jgi:predicted glycosyltransferase